MEKSIASKILYVVDEEARLDARLRAVSAKEQLLDKRDLRDVESLLEHVTELRGSKQAVAEADSIWLGDIYGKWRALYFSLAGESFQPKSKLSALGTSEAGLRRPRVSKPGDLQRWLEQTSFDLAVSRARRMVERWSDEQFVRSVLPWDESAVDWRQAQVCLANELLDGHITFDLLNTVGKYEMLEGEHWLDDLKQLKAYFVWLRRGGGWTPGQSEAHYAEADNLVRIRLTADQPPSMVEFKDVKAYIESTYLEVDGTVRTTAPGKAQGLTETKARRLQSLGNGDNLANWLRAESYVKKFYGNIIRAAVDGDRDAITAVLEAVSSKDLDGRIVNCFEITVAARFLSSETVQSEVPELHDESSALLAAAAGR